MRALASIVPALLLAACNADPCPVPTGCLAAGRSGGACNCSEWETVRTEEVPVPYVVSDVSYDPVGTATVLRYGVTWDPAQVPSSQSSTGTTIRVVVRRPDGTEQIARFGPLPERLWGFERLSPTIVRFGGGGLWTYTTDLDLPPASRDWISLWANPSLELATTYAGEKVVHLDVAPRCFQPVFCAGGPEPMGLSPAAIRGQVSWGAPHDAFVASLGDEQRAALLAFGVRETGGALAFPRFQHLDTVALSDRQASSIDATWSPCSDPGAFEVLAETPFPLRDGDTLVLQYGVQGSGECAPQRPGLLAGTSTPGCAIRAEVFVDRLAGKLLLQPTFASPVCTR